MEIAKENNHNAGRRESPFRCVSTLSLTLFRVYEVGTLFTYVVYLLLFTRTGIY